MQQHNAYRYTVQLGKMSITGEYYNQTLMHGNIVIVLKPKAGG